MNLLPFLLTLILIMALGTSSLLRYALVLSQEQEQIQHYYTQKAQLLDQFERYKYQKAKDKLRPPRKKNTSTTKKPRSTSSSHRDRTDSDKSKWNLSPMLQQEIPYLEEALAHLLYLLYGHTSFWQKEVEIKLAHAFLQKKQALLLTDLQPEDPSLHYIFYKMLQGSGVYDIDTKKGFPPLEDFLMLAPSQPYILSFPYASTLCLQTFLGEKIATAVLTQEKEQNTQTKHTTSISQETLQALLIKEDLPLPSHLLLQYLSFSFARAPLTKLEKASSHTSIQLRLPSKKES